MQDNKKFELGDDALDSVAGGTPSFDDLEAWASLYSDWKAGHRVRLREGICGNCGQPLATGIIHKFVIRKGYCAVSISMDCCDSSQHGLGIIERFHNLDN